MLRIGTPAVLASVLHTAYNLTDAFFVGLLPSGAPQAVMAGIQVSWPFVWFLVSFIGGFVGAVVTALVAQNLGAQRPEAANRALNQLFAISVVSSLVLGFVGFVAMPLILRAFIHEAEVTEQATRYMRIIFAGLPTMMIPQLFAGALQATGNTVTPLLITLVGVGINIPLDAMLVLGLGGAPQLGIGGAALATVIAQGVVTVIFLVLFRRGSGPLRLDRSQQRVESQWVLRSLEIGIPAALGNSSVALGFAFMMTGIGRLENAVAALSGYGVADRLFGLLFIATDGIGVGLATMVGQALGAQDLGRARAVVRSGVRALFFIVLVEAAFVYLARTSLLQLFIRGDSPGAAESLREGTRFIELFAAGMPFLSAFFAVQAVYRGSGHNIPPMVLGILRLWVFRIPLSYVFAFTLGLGSDGVWLGMSASNVLSGLPALFLLVRGRGWQRSVLDGAGRERAP
ncbi:MAG: MATE family efflux transporter [Candidatus Bipolaricaulota bacterium]